MKTTIVPLAILLLGATGIACADHHDLLGTGAELTTTPCNSCASSTMPRLDCPSGRTPRCFQRTDGACGWQNQCSEPTPQAVTCGGLAGLMCAHGQYCQFPAEAQCGAADQTGTCAPIPDACTLEYGPVCGCDGKTYGTPCEAAANAVSVAKTGECPPPSTGSKTCGGIAGITCAKGEYCNTPIEAHCGAADQTGTCAPIPDACTLEYGPVCGCDGKTYGTPCEAAAHSVSVAKTGECPPPSTGAKTCGGIAGITCAKGEYCNTPIDAQCGAADQTGTCSPIPDGCTLEYAPVCGCDGKTYGNACAAAASAVSVAKTGECPPPSTGAKTCGGIAGITCAKGEYCNTPIDAQCGAADQTGTCSPIPDSCTLEYAPVCGCDGKTYGNACSAAAAGVSVSSSGRCP